MYQKNETNLSSGRRRQKSGGDRVPKQNVAGSAAFAKEILDDPKPRRPWGRWFLKVLPWFIIWMQINGVNMRMTQVLNQYGNAPVLVQVGSDARPILAKQTTEGNLNPTNVDGFLHEVIPILWRLDAELPEEMGGGKDPGVTVAKVKVPTPMFFARVALAEPIADGFLAARIKNGPKDLWKGAKQTLSGLQVGEVKPLPGLPNARKVVVSGILTEDAPNGTPRSAQRWARTITVTAVQKPRFLLKKSLIEEKYNLFLSRGLIIASIEDAKEVLP